MLKYLNVDRARNTKNIVRLIRPLNAKSGFKIYNERKHSVGRLIR
jgi:hypothetical protein